MVVFSHRWRPNPGSHPEAESKNSVALSGLCVETPSALPVSRWLEAGRLFEDIQGCGRAIDAVALRIAYPFYDTRTFQSFDGALRGRKRDPQFVRCAFYRDEGIYSQNSDPRYFHNL